MIEKTMSVKSMEWIINLLVLICSRLIPRNPLTYLSSLFWLWSTGLFYQQDFMENCIELFFKILPKWYFGGDGKNFAIDISDP